MYGNENWMGQFRPVAAIIALSQAAQRRLVAKRQDELLDEALKGTFPASDPIGAMRVS